MKYQRFEELPVWQASIDFARWVYALTDHHSFRRHFGLRDQLGRAALSISNNIAEGFERGTNNELLAFLYIARGSAGEARSMLYILESWNVFADAQNEITKLKQQSENISKQLYGWIEQLKQSGYRGQRHQNIMPQERVKVASARRGHRKALSPD